MRFIIQGKVSGYLENDPEKHVGPQEATLVIDVPDTQIVWTGPGVRILSAIPTELTKVSIA